MDYVITFLVATVVSWVTLLIVVPLAQKLADFAMPEWPELLWKLVVVAGVVNALDMLLHPVSGVLAWAVTAVAFWVLMVKWFDVDFFGAVVIVVASMVLRVVAVWLLVGLLPGIA